MLLTFFMAIIVAAAVGMSPIRRRVTIDDLLAADPSELMPIAKVAAIEDVSPPSVWRWVMHGADGVRLLAVKRAGGWKTTPAAVAQFHRDRTAAAMNDCGKIKPDKVSAAERGRCAAEACEAQ